MNKNFKIIFFMILLFHGSISYASEILKIGSKVKTGYSNEISECEVQAFYGNMVTFKSLEAGKQRIFHVLAEKIGEGYFTPNSKIPKEDETLHADLFVDMMIEAKHPNGEWYVGKVLEKYGKFVKVQLGQKNWAPVWVENEQFFKSLKVDKEIKFMDYCHRQVGLLSKDGVLTNNGKSVIGRVYSNGKVYDGSGVVIGNINQDGSIEKNNVTIFKTNFQFNNGLLYLDKENKPLFIIRIKSNSLYQYDRPDIVSLFFESNQLEGSMRVCAGLFLLLKDKF